MAVKLVVLPVVVIALHVVARCHHRVVVAATTLPAKMTVVSVITRDVTAIALGVLMEIGR